MNDSRTVLLIESQSSVLAALGGLIRQAGYSLLAAPSGKEGLIEAWRQRPDLIVVDGELTDLSGLDLLRKLRADPRTAEARMVLISARAAPEDILAGMQAGANKYVVKRSGADADLLRAIQDLFTVAPAEPPPSPPSGKLIAFLSAKGGTGTSSLCANMAQMLSGLAAPRTVCVVDLVLPIGSIGQIVGSDAAATIVDATRWEAERVTPESLREHIAAVPMWNFHLLAGSPDPEAAQSLQVGRLEAVFNALRQAYDFVLVDFGRSLSRISLPLIQASSRLVMILSADRAAVALTRTTLKYLELQGVRRNFFYPILNRAVGLEGMTKAEMEQELALVIPGMIPYMGSSFALANNLHQAIALKFPNDTATFALHDLTAGLLNQIEEVAPA